jgi:hypothetical protein
VVNSHVCRLPYTFGKLKKLVDVGFLSNPYEFPTMEDIQRGLEHVQWLCHHEGLKYFRGPPPVLKVVRTGIANEGCFYEADFGAQLKAKLEEAKTSFKIDLNFKNFPVSEVLRLRLRVQCSAMAEHVTSCHVTSRPRVACVRVTDTGNPRGHVAAAVAVHGAKGPAACGQPLGEAAHEVLHVHCTEHPGAAAQQPCGAA